MARLELFVCILFCLGLGLEAEICSTNFERVGKKCIFVSTEKVNWFDADRKCSNLNANLLVLDDDHEKTLLTDHLTRNHRISQRFWDSMWVGINSLSQARRFVRSSNGDSISYMPWLRHEPNNQNGDENCVSFANYGGEWGSGYLDIRCNIELLYMCEMRELNYLDLLVL